MLSPSEGQVAYALLTRSPLSYLMFSAEASNGEATPFDLHVLGTPPAFILSQDRTLTFKSLILTRTIAGPVRFYIFRRL